MLSDVVAEEVYEQGGYTDRQPRPLSGGQDVPARGRLWVDSSSGRVLRTKLRVGGSGSVSRLATLVVTYEFREELGAWLPAEMRESYEDSRDPKAQRLEGVAVYGNYRRLDVRGGLRSQKP